MKLSLILLAVGVMLAVVVAVRPPENRLPRGNGQGRGGQGQLNDHGRQRPEPDAETTGSAPAGTVIFRGCDETCTF